MGRIVSPLFPLLVQHPETPRVRVFAALKTTPVREWAGVRAELPRFQWECPPACRLSALASPLSHAPHVTDKAIINGYKQKPKADVDNEQPHISEQSQCLTRGTTVRLGARGHRVHCSLSLLSFPHVTLPDCAACASNATSFIPRHPSRLALVRSRA